MKKKVGRKPKKPETVSIYLVEGPLEEQSKKLIQVPTDFLADLKGEVLMDRPIVVSSYGVSYCRAHDTRADDYVFVAASITPRQQKMVYG